MVMTPDNGPYEAWCTTAQLRCGVQTGSPIFTDDQYIEIASTTLYELSGRRFPGTATKTEWPTSWRTGWTNTVTLDTPWRVLGIDSVYVDGALVAATDYEVHDWRDLVRTPTAAGVNVGWPAGQRNDLDGGTGSFVVTYTHGEPIPLLGQLAAAVLTCALKSLWCNNPVLTHQQAKQNAVRAALDLDEVVTFLAAYPQVVPVLVWSPETSVGVRKTWP